MALDFDALQRNYTPIDINPQKKQGKKKDFWTDQISTGGGIGGALAGAAGGAALGSVVPVIGTGIGGLVGAILGGAAGSGGGELAENYITNEDDKLKNVGKEALLGGIFSAPPARLAKAAVGGAKALAGVAGKEATQQATRTGAEKVSQTLLGDAWGIKSGAKVGGANVTPQRAKELQEFVRTNVGVPKTANADTVYERTVNLRNSTGEAIGAAIKNASPLDTKLSQSLNEGLTNRFNKVIGGNAANNQVAQDILLRAKQATSPQELWELRRSIDDSLINFNRNPASVTPGAEQFARVARDEINKTLNKSVPDIKQLNKSYSNAFDVEDLVASAAKTPKGVQAPGYMGRVGGNIAQRGRALVGQTISQPAEKVATSAAGKPSARGIIGRQALYGSLTQQGVESRPEQSPASLEAALMQQSMPVSLVQEQQLQDPYPRENLIADIQRDPENAQKYIAYYGAMQEALSSGAPEEKPLSTTAAKDISNAQTGLDAVSLIEQQLSNDPSLQQRGGVSGAFNPMGLVSGILGTGEYENARAQARDVIGRIRTGAALTADEAKAFDRFLPQPGDNAQTVQQKLAFLRNQFTTVADRRNTGADLSSALMGARTL